MIKPDQPIKSIKDDILERKPFAKAIAEAVITYQREESIVAGLYGEWGSGKTSIINMVLEYINEITNNETQKDPPYIIKFNPWNFSDQNQLIAQFFSQLSSTLKKPNYSKEAWEIGELLEKYGKMLQPLEYIPKIGRISSIMSRIFQDIGESSKSWSIFKSNNLVSLKSELNDLILQKQKKLIVIIDDIDRLNKLEIRQIFQLVKSLGDFNNTIYILAFDRSIIENVLNEFQGAKGSDYLEKIVQVPFNIPLISKHDIETLLIKRIEELFHDLPEEKIDKQYYGNIYHSGLKYFFKNIRDVTRYFNILYFGYDLVKTEVNPVDFLAITAIQTFIPDLYLGIKNNKKLFAGDIESILQNASGINADKVKKESKAACEHMFNSNDVLSKDIIIELLKRLFPKVDSYYSNNEWNTGLLEQWRRNNRICSPKKFDIYFRLSIPNNEISNREMDEIIKSAKNIDAFRNNLLLLNEDKRINRFLERLEDYTTDLIPIEHIESIIIVLMDIGDSIPHERTGFYMIDTPIQIIDRIFSKLSHRYPDPERRFSIIKNAIEKATNSLYTIVSEVNKQDLQHNREDSQGTEYVETEHTIKPHHLEVLKKIACDKIEIWANDKRLLSRRDFSTILYCWKRWGNKNQIEAYIEKLIKDDEGLVTFITHFLYEISSHKSDDYISTKTWRIRLNYIEEYINKDQLEHRIRKIKSSSTFTKLEEEKKLAISILLDTINEKIKNR